MRMPPAVKYLLLANIICFIASWALPVDSFCALYYFGSGHFAPYQLFTYMFMHAGFAHLFFNMFALWMFGRVMEQAWGTKRFLLYYLVCGVGAGLVQEAGQVLGLISPYAMTVGASGAVYGILLAFGMTFPEERLFIIPIPFPIKAKYFVMFYAALEVFQGFGSSDGVAHFAHLGGMLFGLVLILYWRSQAKRHRYGGAYWSSTSSYGGYDKGGDDGFFSKMKSAFGGDKARKPKMDVHYGGEHHSDYVYNEQKKRDNEEIDRILDKIRKNGYSCLTNEEKDTLFKASNK